MPVNLVIPVRDVAIEGRKKVMKRGVGEAIAQPGNLKLLLDVLWIEDTSTKAVVDRMRRDIARVLGTMG